MAKRHEVPSRVPADLPAIQAAERRYRTLGTADELKPWPILVKD